jgi:hypothetical protein
VDLDQLDEAAPSSVKAMTLFVAEAQDDPLPEDLPSLRSKSPASPSSS